MALAGGKEYIHASSGLNTEERKCAGWKISCGLVTRLKTNFVMMVYGCVLSEGKNTNVKQQKLSSAPGHNHQLQRVEKRQKRQYLIGDEKRETVFNRRQHVLRQILQLLPACN